MLNDCMNLEYSDKKTLIANCPNCRSSGLLLITTKAKNQDFLACKTCKFTIFVIDLKKQLFVV